MPDPHRFAQASTLLEEGVTNAAKCTNPQDKLVSMARGFCLALSQVLKAAEDDIRRNEH